MNERIKELAQEAYDFSLRTDGTFYGEVYDKKFAELIVQECLNQCYNRGLNDELYAGQLKAAEYIKEHFGIEK